MRLSWIARGAASADRARRQMEIRGCTPNGHPLWARWEVNPVLDMYPAYPAIFPMIPRRSHAAVYSKAGRLGITKPNVPWSDNELTRLRRIYPTQDRAVIVEALPGRSWGAIQKKANARKIYRKMRPEPPTGIRILDQILQRARDKGISLVELDKFSRTKTYFRNRRWRTGPDTDAHCRAARALGGTLRASFQ